MGLLASKSLASYFMTVHVLMQCIVSPCSWENILRLHVQAAVSQFVERRRLLLSRLAAKTQILGIMNHAMSAAIHVINCSRYLASPNRALMDALKIRTTLPAFALWTKTTIAATLLLREGASLCRCSITLCSRICDLSVRFCNREHAFEISQTLALKC